ncbi:putative GTPase-activating protein gyp1 [Paratrimastix pyriformis]|uniref:GTPase-activating protein gyp1 n=1 Tax=Paratrimastix pyriformis TaxID=342808 RepID=A0ABQ8UPK7_9EUKA|nr:putative GTPase-activating protein gyp1 [Paratrimastix pyriformis]
MTHSVFSAFQAEETWSNRAERKKTGRNGYARGTPPNEASLHLVRCGSPEPSGPFSKITSPSSTAPITSGSPFLSPAQREMGRIRRFRDLVDAPDVDMADHPRSSCATPPPLASPEALKKMAWDGVPPVVRSPVWQLLLGYLPSHRERQVATIERKRAEYWACIPQYFTDIETLPPYERSLRHQIAIDVPRTNPDCPLVQNPVIQKMLERVLYIWAIRHPASGYVQGINDLATPFFVAFLRPFFDLDDPAQQDLGTLSAAQLNEVEADAYWCLSKMLDDPAKLARHLESQHVQYLQFAFRWMNCLLTREFPSPLLLRLLDTYFAEGDGYPLFHVFVCAALLIKYSKELMPLDFQGIIIFLQPQPSRPPGRH